MSEKTSRFDAPTISISAPANGSCVSTSGAVTVEVAVVGEGGMRVHA